MNIYSISNEERFNLDSNEFPPDYHYLKVTCLKDREIKQNIQVIVSYRDEVILRSENIDDYEKISKNLKQKQYRLRVIEDRLCIIL